MPAGNSPEFQAVTIPPVGPPWLLIALRALDHTTTIDIEGYCPNATMVQMCLKDDTIRMVSVPVRSMFDETEPKSKTFEDVLVGRASLREIGVYLPTTQEQVQRELAERHRDGRVVLGWIYNFPYNKIINLSEHETA